MAARIDPAKAQPLWNAFGACLPGFDAREADEADVQAIVDLLDRHSVIALPRQEMDDAQLLSFSLRFGSLDTSYRDRVRQTNNLTGVTRVSNLASDGTIMAPDDPLRITSRGAALWHTDLSFLKVPNRYTFLLARELPATGGNTEFCDMYAAFEALSPALQQEYQSIEVIHNWFHSRATLGDTDFTEAERAAFPPQPQPLVRTNPRTGRKALYLASHASHVLGWPEARGRALIEELTAFATQPAFVGSYAWREAGELVIWDNAATMHRATPFPSFTQRRLLARVGISEPGPVAA